MNRGAKKAGAGHAKHPFGNSKGIESPIPETKSARNSIGRARLARCRVFLHQPANGNRAQGEVMLHNTRKCTILADGRLVGVVGVNNLIIVDTPDALLVADRAQAKDVRHIFASLKARGDEAHKLPLTAHRPWGTYTAQEDGVSFKIKRIEVKPGASLSLQMHHHSRPSALSTQPGLGTLLDDLSANG